MSTEKLQRMSQDAGFIAALDQSGGSTPRALESYGIGPEAYSNDEEMFALVHEMRARIMTNPAFTGEHILGAILFEGTMEREVAGKLTADYLWEEKRILPFLKIDQGLAPEADGVQLLNPIPGLKELLAKAQQHHIFGTKERSLIKLANKAGIDQVVKQQIELAQAVAAAGLVPIVEPEVSIDSPEKAAAERLLKAALLEAIAGLDEEIKIILKLTIPTEANLYAELLDDPRVVRIVALSGGYSQAAANELLSQNHGVIASFSRALAEGLTAGQSEEEYTAHLEASIMNIYQASTT